MEFEEDQGFDPTRLAAPVIAVAAAFLLFQVIGSLIGWLVMLGVAAGIGYVANRLSPGRVPHGWLGTLAVGLLGAWLGGWLFGAFGPKVAGIAILPTLLGASLLTYGLQVKRTMERNKVLEEFQARADVADPRIMSKLGDYRLIDKVGEGATAAVYRGIPDDTLLEKDAVAVKVLTPASIEDEEFMKRLQREFKLCQTLRHPSIVQMYEMGEQNGLHYLVLELLDGTTLREKLQGQPLPIAGVLDGVIPLFEGLAHAHQIGILHRDLKPDNIMVTTRGLKLMDFGLARAQGDSNVTKTGTALGTPAYMSPEQIKGETSKHVDPRSDQYAIGVVLYEMLAGRTPFQDRDAMGVMFQHVSQPAPPLRDFRPEVSEELERVVMKMLEKEAEDRYSSLSQVADDLREIRSRLETPSNQGHQRAAQS